MGANRDINELSPLTQQKLKLVLAEVGDIIFITEGYRSQARQQELYAQGRTAPGAIVTHTLKSNHTGRRAIDIAFKGPRLYPASWDRRWKEVSDVFKKHGFNWGGDWKNRKDRPHFEDNGKPLDIIDIIMLFYEELWNKNYKDLDNKIFKDPYAFIERTKKLKASEKHSEGVFLLAILAEKLGKEKANKEDCSGCPK